MDTVGNGDSCEGGGVELDRKYLEIFNVKTPLLRRVVEWFSFRDVHEHRM